MKALVGGDCHRTNNSNFKKDIFFMLIDAAIAIAPYKHYNLTYLSQNIFLNVKIINRHRSLKCQI